MAANIDNSERLFNLTCALVVSKRGLTKGEIFTSVQGYKERLKTSSFEAMDKLFDRDKTDLAKSGVLVIGEIPAVEDKNNQEHRYRIPNESFVWPEDTKLTARQVSLLNLAAQVWAKASLSQEVEHAVMRLRALGDIPEDSGIIGVAPSITTQDRNFTRLSLAIDEAQTVRFHYRKPGGAAVEVRTVQPWRLQNINGQWLLVSFDTDRNAVRNFLLKRIVDKRKITVLEDLTFTKPTQAQLNEAIAELEQLAQQQVAKVRVKPNSMAWNHYELDLPGRATDDTVNIHYMDEELLAEKLRSFGTDVEVLEPASLAETINTGLEKVAADHA